MTTLDPNDSIIKFIGTMPQVLQKFVFASIVWNQQVYVMIMNMKMKYISHEKIFTFRYSHLLIVI